jgi:DNA-binding SARP family transcriptional activator
LPSPFTSADKLALLGVPCLGTRVLPDERPTQLLVLLATTAGGVLPRAEAAARLWPALDDAARLRNLRKTLHRLRAQHGEALIDADGALLLLRVPTDLAELDRLLQQGRASEALALLRGPLAEGLAADEPAPPWLQTAREQALARWRHALLAALPTLPPARAEAELLRLRALDPLDEPLLRAHLDRLAADGRREAWLRERRTYEQRLQTELGLPLPAALQGEPGPAPADRAAPAVAPRAGFVGRDDELEQLAPRLAEPGLRLVLRGPGGIGKTQLAAALARRAPPAGLAVVWWPLADSADAVGAFGRLAAELGAERADEAALAAALRRRPTLVVADNAETLFDAAPGFGPALHALAEAAPETRWLLTARRMPELPGLVDVPVGGLDLPDPADPPGAVLRSAAVRLLVDRASALDPAFEPRPQAAALGRLARALAGHPLALELAAAQLRTAPAETLAREAEAGGADAELDALFDASWRALPPALQAALLRLAVLPPGLSRAAVRAGGALSPAALQALVLRSWLEPEPAPGPVSNDALPAPTRWRLHPLLRAWLRRQQPADAATAREALQAAIDAVLADGQAVLAPGGTDAPGALDWMERELPLLREAFSQAVDRGDAPRLAGLTPALAALFEQRGRRAEGLALLADAATRLATRPLAARGPVQSARALLCLRAGRLDEAWLLARGLARARSRERATSARTRGLVLWQRGELDAARKAFDTAHALAVEHGFDDLVPDAVNNRALIDHVAGREAEAERGYRQVAALAAARGSVRLQAMALLNLGSLLHPAGQGHAAREALEAALALIDAHGLHSIRAHALGNLSGALLEIGDAEAVAALRALLPQLQAALPAGETAQHLTLHRVHALLHARHGNATAAWVPLREAWRSALALGVVTQQSGIALDATQAWIATDRRRTALAWLAWLQNHAHWDADRREAARLAAGLYPTDAETQEARAAAASLSLDALGAALEQEARAHP